MNENDYYNIGNEKFINLLDDDKNEEFIEFFEKNQKRVIEYKSEEGLTILHIIIEKNLEDLLKKIINNVKKTLSPEGFKNFLDFKDKNGRTPFHFACYYGNMKIIKFLLEQGVDYTLKGNTGLGCLHFSAMKDKVTPIYYMIKSYDINKEDKDCKGNTFFHWACYCSSERIINFFLNDITFDINIENNDRFIPLHFYIMSRSTHCIKRLMIRGADPNKVNKEGKNAKDIVNEIYNKEENKNKKDNILQILNRKRFNKNFEFYTFIISHFIFFFIIIIFFIEQKCHRIIFLIWFLFIGAIVCCFIKKDPGTYESKSDDYLLKKIKTKEDNFFKIYNYCIKCQIKQKMYTKHCFYCDKCIMEFDHHCKWFNTCIGKNNKNCFNILLFILSFNSLIYFILFSVFLVKSKNNNFKIIKILVFLLNLLFFIGINIIIIPLIKFFFQQTLKSIISGESNNRSRIESSDSDENTKLLLEDDNK